MLKKTIAYVDFDGNPQSGVYYFNLTKAEIIEMELRSNGTLREDLQAVTDSNDGKVIMDKFREIINMAYGVRSEDGTRFIKSDDISKEFSQTAAFDVFFVSLVTDADAAAQFVNGLLPQDLVGQQAREDGRPALQDHLKKAPITQLEVAPPVLAEVPKLAPSEDADYQEYVAKRKLEQEQAEAATTTIEQ